MHINAENMIHCFNQLTSIKRSNNLRSHE